MAKDFDADTLAHYHNVLKKLNPKGAPTAHLIYTPPNKICTIGILDASFNPMTLAHEALVHTAQNTQNLDGGLLMLSGANVDKEVFGATLEQRLAMLVHYAKQQQNVSVALCSHARFVDKVTALKSFYDADVTFYFIVGFDTLIRIFDPKYYTDMHADLERLFQSCHFIAANRGDNDEEALAAYLKKQDVRPFAQKIHPISLPKTMANVSSTKVRENIKASQTIDHLVPKAISEAIFAQNLYKE